MIQSKHMQAKGLPLCCLQKSSSLISSHLESILKSNSSKAMSPNHYKRFGSASPCLLDAFLIANNETIADSYGSEGGLKITREGYTRLKDWPRNGFTKRRILTCSRAEQKNVGRIMRKKRKPRSANLGSTGLSRPIKNQISLKEYLSWITRKAMLFLSKTASLLYQRKKQTL